MWTSRKSADGTNKNNRRQHMAHWGISNTHVNQLGDTASSKRSPTTRNADLRKKMQTVFHVALLSAAFVFVAAIVCGVLV
jgi:predicted phage tail protein